MHQDYLQKALELAEKRRGFCAPNPSVGAIIVKDNQIIGEGNHLSAGKAHAEIAALRHVKNKNDAKGAVMYVTLEPCCHQGKTGPCTDAIIKAGIAKVFFAYHDPNPKVRDKSVKQFEKAGVEVEYIEHAETSQFYQSYHHWVNEQRPIVTAKLALSLDGKIAGIKGERLIITGSELQKFTQHCRQKSDAIITSVKTIVADDPKLNVRLFGKAIAKPLYILDRRLEISDKQEIFETAKKITLIHSPRADKKKKEKWEKQGVRCVPVASNKNGLDLEASLKMIGEDGVHDLWVETGGRCFQSFLENDLLHRALVYVAAKTIGVQGVSAFHAKENIFKKAKTVQWEIVGKDAVCGLTFN